MRGSILCSLLCGLAGALYRSCRWLSYVGVCWEDEICAPATWQLVTLHLFKHYASVQAPTCLLCVQVAS